MKWSVELLGVGSGGLTTSLPHHTPTPQRWYVVTPPLHTYYFAHSTTQFQKTYPPPPLFLPTGFPAPSTARPPVNGTLTRKTPMILFCSWLHPSKPGVVLPRSHTTPFPCLIHRLPLFTPPMPINDPIKQREASRRHYEKHRDRAIASAKKYSKIARERTRAFISDYLKTNPCVDCGETDTIVLEFDHVGKAGSKDFNISDATRKGVSMQRLKDEIAKCEVRCANCHRKKTYERNGSTHKN